MIASQSLFDPTSYILNYGLLGVVMVMLITGLLWVKPSVDRIEQEKNRAVQEKDKAQAQRDEALEVAQEKIIPILVKFVDTTEALLPLIQTLAMETRRDTQRRQRERDDDD